MSSISTQAGHAGRQAHQSEWIDRAARIGLVAYGVVHLLVRAVVPGWEWVATGAVVVVCLLFLRQPRGTPPKDWGK
jgi:hypothetical protein